MEFNTAYNKPNSFFKEKKAVVTNDLLNINNDLITKGSTVTITGKSRGMKAFFDVVSENGIHIDNVSFENLKLK
jgi:hypothetical protein